ncbi:MAG TPA: AmmeMemoRadiSam system protein B [Acetobacteraceae bacterium]|nr:AmmeMemoRadiSam system protein B [Acetobacteraceae bacterium]
MMNAIRQPAVAGTFYPAQRDVLERQLTQFLSEAANDAPAAASPKAIIGPHAGYIYSGSVAARAYARLAGARGRIKRVVLIGPSHYIAFRGIAVDASEAWAMPSGTVTIDREAFDLLRAMPMVGVLDAAHEREHALEVHVPFLQQVLGDFRLVPIVTGDAPPEAVAAVIEALWGGPETLIVISTDLSHYLDYAACQQIDQATADAIERFDPDVLTPTHACGSLATKGLLRAAKARGMAIERLDLRNSGDTAGPRDRVVGYGAWALYERGAVDDESAKIDAIGPMLIDLARRSILFGLDTGFPPQVITDASLPPVLAAPGAAFVTLRRPDGSLRGCIGSVIATRPLAVDVVQHAFNSAFRDWRFPRLSWLELAGLSLSVSVLTPPTPMQFEGEADLLAQLQPRIDGVIIEDMGLRSLFLPSVWEEIPDKRHFVTALKLKAGMQADHFSPQFQAQRFRSIEVKGAMEAGLGQSNGPLGWKVLPPS